MEVLLEASARIFEEQGYAGTTTNHIAERAGVSIGTLYQYYPSKDALAVALMMRHLEAGQRMIAKLGQELAASPHDLKATLHSVVEAMLQLHMDRPRLQHLLLEEAPRIPQVEAEMHRLDENAVGVVMSLLAQFSTIRQPPNQMTAYMLVQTVELLTHAFIAHPPRGVSRSDFSNELVSMLLGYLTGNAADCSR